MIKLYLLKANKESKKTPVYVQSFLDIAKGKIVDPNLLTSADGEKICAISEDGTFYGKDLYNKVKISVDDYNFHRKAKIDELYAARKEELEKSISGFSDKEKELFGLLYGNLQVDVDDGENSLDAGLFFKGVSLSKISVLKSEVPKEINW